MQIPFTINLNTLKTYEQPKLDPKNATLQSGNFTNWDRGIPKSLQELCIETIAANWEEYPLLDELILPEDRCLLLNILSIHLPLALTVPKIADNIYWQRCYLHKWPKLLPRNVGNDFLAVNIVKIPSRRASNISSNTKRQPAVDEKKHKSWKECFIEMYIREYLENLKPELYQPEKMKELSDVCEPYVKVLNIAQLQCPSASCNRIPLNSVLTGFKNLTDLSLCFKQTYCGGKFSWNILRVSLNDVKLLANGLESCKLVNFALVNSDIDDEKVIVVVKALLRQESLEKVDFSHCKIANRGAIALARFLTENRARELILTNNRIDGEGVEALSYAICKNEASLRSLCLKMNPIRDEGGVYLVNALTVGARGLEMLDISGCKLTGERFSLGEMIEMNLRLQSLNLCNNPFKEDTGLAIIHGLRYNSTITKLDVRFCNLNSNDEHAIMDKVEINRKNAKTATAKKPIIVEPVFELELSDELQTKMETIFNTTEKEKPFSK